MQSEVFFRIHLFLWLGRHHDRKAATGGRDLDPLAALMRTHHWSNAEDEQQGRGKSFAHQLTPHTLFFFVERCPEFNRLARKITNRVAPVAIRQRDRADESPGLDACEYP